VNLETRDGPPSSAHALPIEDADHPPGFLHLTSDEKPKIFLLDYGPDNVTSKELSDIDECVSYLGDEGVTWVDIRGISNRRTFERAGEIFKIHPLALEDCVNVPQRPKSDVYPEQQTLITRMASLEDGLLVTEQLSIVFGKGFVLTVQEEPDTDCLEPLRQRIREGRGGIRKHGADFLAYAILDAVVDGFYPVLEHYGEKLDALEVKVAEMRHADSTQIFSMKRELLDLRRAIWPQRDLFSALMRDDSPHILAETRVYLRDTYDHVVQVMDMVETFREIASSLMDLFMTGVSNRMNGIMKVLTIVSTVFLPMTFIAGVYGMNFNRDKSPLNMPELDWYYGYPFALVLMLASAGSLLLYYRYKGWLSQDRIAGPRKKRRVSDRSD
jgi:magnesium transporter